MSDSSDNNSDYESDIEVILETTKPEADTTKPEEADTTSYQPWTSVNKKYIRSLSDKKSTVVKASNIRKPETIVKTSLRKKNSHTKDIRKVNPLEVYDFINHYFTSYKASMMPFQLLQQFLETKCNYIGVVGLFFNMEELNSYYVEKFDKDYFILRK